MAETSILIVDDHAVLRTGIRLMLQSQPDFRIVGEAVDGEAAISLARKLKPDVILLDLSMPRLSGHKALPALRRASPQSKILVLTMHDDKTYLQAAFKGGARGYIVKKAADIELISAIRSVSRGEIYLHPSMMGDALDDLLPQDQTAQTEEKGQWENLSIREREVLQFVALGYTNAEIAEKIFLSIKTVETYRARGMEKLNLRTRAALVKFALTHGLLDD